MNWYMLKTIIKCVQFIRDHIVERWCRKTCRAWMILKDQRRSEKAQRFKVCDLLQEVQPTGLE